MADREAKKQRLRELRDTYDCVKTIVNHIGKYYRAAEPPPWLDLRAVAGQLMRSTASNSKHAAWRHLRESMLSIETWMGGHNSWEDAIKVGNMPHIGTPSEIKAAEFIEGKGAALPRSLLQSLRNIKLDFLLDAHPRRDDKVPDFWKGAKLSDPIWRINNMLKSNYGRQLPFDDDLTDLVLSAVCRKPQPDVEGAPQPSGPPQAAEADAGFELSEEEIKPNKAPTTTPDDKPSGQAEVWEEVQASMSRIADTVNGTLAAEQVKLLGKRYRQDNEPTQPDIQKKRHKTVEQAPQPQKVMDTIEDSDDDQSSVLPAPSACVVKEDDRFRVLKVGYKKLKKHAQQLVTSVNSLDESTKKLAKDTEQLTKQHKDLRKDYNTEKQKHQQLVERCGGLETQTKRLEEKIEQPTVQCAALTDDVRKLEDRGAQMAAKCTAFEDENKILRAQVVSLMARVEALEQAQSASKAAAEPDRTVASASTDRARPAEDAGQVRSQHPDAHEGRPNDRTGRGPRDDGHGVAAAAAPLSQWQSAGAVKYESIDNAVLNQAPRHYKRAGSRFPRVLEMPSFEPTWDPQQEVASRRAPGYSRPPAPIIHLDDIDGPYNQARPHQNAHPTSGIPTQAWSPDQMPPPVQMPGPGQTFAPAPAPAALSAPAPTQYGVPTFIDPALTHRPSPSPIAAPLPFTAATLQLEPQPQTQAHPQAAAQQHQSTIPTPAPNHYTNHNPLATPNPNHTPHANPHPNTTGIKTGNPNPNPNNSNPNTNSNPSPSRSLQQPPHQYLHQTLLQQTLQTHLPHLNTLPPAPKHQLLAFLSTLDKHIWAAPTAAIVAHCEARGLRYDGLGKVVEVYRGVMRGFSGGSGQGGDGMGEGGWVEGMRDGNGGGRGGERMGEGGGWVEGGVDGMRDGNGNGGGRVKGEEAAVGTGQRDGVREGDGGGRVKAE